MFRKKPQLSREQSLSAIPIQNNAVSVSRDDAGLVSISIPRKDSWWVNALSRVFFVPEEKRVGLDEIGSYVWDLCDGKNDVRSIIGQFQKEYRLNRKEAELSMLNYLKMLAKKKLIGLLIKEPQQGKKKGKKRKR